MSLLFLNAGSCGNLHENEYLKGYTNQCGHEFGQFETNLANFGSEDDFARCRYWYSKQSDEMMSLSTGNAVLL